eukprot:213981_1
MSYKASLNSGVYGSFHWDPSIPLPIPLIMNNIGNRPIIPVSTYSAVPLNMIQRNYPIMPVEMDTTPIVNTDQILKIASKHTNVSGALAELSKKLPFSRVTNYIVAKQMILDLLKDDPIKIHDDITSNEYSTPVGGYDDMIASFSSTTLQKLGTIDDKPKRKPFVGGNWKSNGTVKSVSVLADGLAAINTTGIDVLVAPLPIHIPIVQSKLSKSKIIISCQNVSATKTGAFTGEIASTQLIDLGVNTTLIGHSERRKYYGETNEIITKKVAIALKNKLNIVCCLGETLAQRKANKVEEVCRASMQAIADGVGKNGWDNVVIAYEPVWAIGTGVACSPDKAEETHYGIRKWFKETISDAVSRSIRIIYGGSVKPKNCKELIAQPDIDGFLVGGAALKAESFGKIIAGVQEAVDAKASK